MAEVHPRRGHRPDVPDLGLPGRSTETCGWAPRPGCANSCGITAPRFQSSAPTTPGYWVAGTGYWITASTPGEDKDLRPVLADVRGNGEIDLSAIPGALITRTSAARQHLWSLPVLLLAPRRSRCWHRRRDGVSATRWPRRIMRPEFHQLPATSTPHRPRPCRPGCRRNVQGQQAASRPAGARTESPGTGFRSAAWLALTTSLTLDTAAVREVDLEVELDTMLTSTTGGLLAVIVQRSLLVRS
jgi:hypothetical protein